MGLRRHANLASYALGSVVKYRTRSVVILLGLMMSTTLLCSIYFIRDGLVTDLSASLDEGPDILVQRLEAGRQVPLPSDWTNNVSSVPGVRFVFPRVWGYMDTGNGRLLTVMGVNATDYGLAFGTAGTRTIGAGRFLEDNASRELVVGQGVLDLMNTAASPVSIGVGSEIQLISYNGSLIPFEIVGIFSTESKIYSYDLVLTDIDSARDLFGVTEEMCTDLAVWIELNGNVNAVALSIDSGIPMSRVLTRDAMRNASLSNYESSAGIMGFLWIVVLLCVVILAFVASSAGSEEVRREVGLLKALGFDTIDVLEIRFVESLVLGIMGANLGISAAILFDYVLGAPFLADYLLGWSVVLLNGGLPLAVLPQTIFITYAISVIPILVATVIPSWRSAVAEPDFVLRGL